MAFLREFRSGSKKNHHDGTNLLNARITLYISYAKVATLMNMFIHNSKSSSGINRRALKGAQD